MYKIIIVSVFLIFSSCSTNNEKNNLDTPTLFIKAADMSFLPLIESENGQYKNNNQIQDPLLTLKNSGCNTIRLRLWHTPSDLHSGLAEVKTLSNRCRQLGLKIWLTVHYSDTWADPSAQTKPASWQNMNFTNLRNAVSAYTSQIMDEINPDIIQIGNETNDGMLWPEGKLSSNETQYIELVNTAITSIRQKSNTTKIMLHYAGLTGADYFFNKVNGLNYDYIGLSYYPIWHGQSLYNLQTTINQLSQTFNKKVLIAETAYPFTLNYNDYTNNIIGFQNQLINTYPATEIGQKDFLTTIHNIMKQSSNGLGYCYWGAEWIAFRGPTATNGSSWENQALWDFNSNALPVLSVFNQN